jgi:hypothetical protein
MPEAELRLMPLRSDQVPPNMVASTPERIKTALLALQTQASSASELIGCLREGKNAAELVEAAKAHLRTSQEIIRVMPRECFVVVEAARLLGKPIPDVTLKDLAFTGLIVLNF